MATAEPDITKITQNEQQRKMGHCVDYRKYLFCRLIRLDDGLAERGITWTLRLIMAHEVLMVTFGFVSFLFCTKTKSKLDNLRSCLLEIIVVTTLFNEYFNRKPLARLHRFMDELMSTSKTGLPEEEIILEEARKRSKTYLSTYILIFFFNGLAMAFSQPLAEYLVGNSWKKLPFPWIEPTSDVDFWVVYIFQCIGLYYSHCVGMVLMSFSAITIQMTALFDVLLLSINHIEDQCAAKMKTYRMDRRRAIYECLKGDLIHHQHLVRELISATPHLQWTFFALSVTISMIMACEAYPLIMGHFTPGELIKGLLFLVVQFMCWAQMCARMEVMSDQNTAVFDALYGTPWYESGTRYKKLMHTTQIFSKRPMSIKSPLFTDMSATMATFYSFVVSSFNLLNLIRKMK